MQYGHGEVIVRQGETPQGLYIVHDGRCTVQRELNIHEAGGKKLVRKMASGTPPHHPSPWEDPSPDALSWWW